MARQLRPVTPLAEEILASGKPAYVVAAEVGINYNRLLDYADGRVDLSPAHEARLERYFGGGPSEPNGITSGDPIEFSASVLGIAAVPRKGAVMTVVIDGQPARLEPLWLVASRHQRVRVECLLPWTATTVKFDASIERAVLKRSSSVRLDLRVGNASDLATVGLTSGPVMFRVVPYAEVAPTG
jgi:hypothetical protein